MNCVEKLTSILLGLIIIASTVGSVQYIYADHLESDKGIFRSHGEVNLVTTKGTSLNDIVTTGDSNFEIYLQLIIRNENNQLINVTESTARGAYIDHAITDHVFDTLMGEKEVITIDNVEYEKAQWKFTPTVEHRFMGIFPIYSEVNLEFNTDDEEVKFKMYETNKPHSVWKAHYCATFGGGHGFQCIPVLQVLVPTMVLEPTDIVEQQWTVLRELS